LQYILSLLGAAGSAALDASVLTLANSISAAGNLGAASQNVLNGITDNITASQTINNGLINNNGVNS
jgi:hypothetical protein